MTPTSGARVAARSRERNTAQPYIFVSFQPIIAQAGSVEWLLAPCQDIPGRCRRDA